MLSFIIKLLGGNSGRVLVLVAIGAKPEKC